MCGHCSKSFGSARALKIHEVKQHESSSRHFLKCANCDEVFEHTNLLQIHMRVHHNVRLRCIRCKDMFDNPAMLRMHFKEHHSDPICLVCGLKFDHDKLLRLHMEHYHKVSGKTSKRDVVAFCEELSVKMAAPASDDLTNSSSSDPSPDPEQRSNPCDSLGPEGKAVTRGSQERNGFVRDEEMVMSEITAHADDDDGGENDSLPPPESEKRSEKPSAPSVPSASESRLSPSRVSLASREIKQERDDEGCNERRVHTSDPSDSSVEDKREGREKTLDIHAATLGSDARHQRPSVIATVSCSAERPDPRTTKENSSHTELGAESRTVLEKMPPTIHEEPANQASVCLTREPANQASVCLKREPAEPCEDSQVWEEGGEDRLLARRPAPRCNRCQQWFPSKMEYLHHLISHQDEELPAEDSDSLDDTDTNEHGPRTSDFRAGPKRWSVPDIRRPVTGSMSLFSELHAAKRHSVPDIRPRPVASDGGASPGKGLYGTVACSECMDVFFDSRSCKIHIEKCHTKPECRECGLQFDHKNLHKIHMSAYHSSDPLLQCYPCGQKFKERAAFVAHVTSHETQTSKSGAKSPDRGSDRGDSPGDRSSIVKAGDARRGTEASGKDSEISHRKSAFRCPPDCEKDDAEAEGPQAEKRRETRTRIFMPRFGDVPYPPGKKEFTDRRVAHVHHADGEEREAGAKSNAEPRPEQRSPGADIPVKTSERPPRTIDPTKEMTPSVERSGTSDAQDYKAGIKRPGTPAKDSKAESKRAGPPPLIPVRQATAASPEPFVADGISAAELAVRYSSPPPSSAMPAPQGPFSPWRHMKSASPDAPKNVRLADVQPLAKEALLNSLCLRRRASAPELMGFYRPKLTESAARSLVGAAQIDEVDGDRSDPKGRGKGAFPSSTSFRARQMAMRYQPRRSQPGDFTCQRCGIFFGHKKLLKIHLDSYHGDNQSLQCLHCNRTFDDRAKFLDHVVAHQKDQQDSPQKAESAMLYRRKHSAPEVILRSSTARLESLYNKALMNSQRAGLKSAEGDSSETEDVKTHNRESPGPEDDFLGTSRREFGLSEGEEDSANFCFVCGKSFESSKELDQHVASHAILSVDGRYCCSLCHKTFDQHRKLEIHTRSHTGFKPHKCEYCGRCFPYYSSYYYHKMTHSDQKRHRCEVCGKGFIQLRYLRAHLKSHEQGTKPSAGSGAPETQQGRESGPASEGLVEIKIELNDHHQKFMAERIADLGKKAAAGYTEVRNSSNGGDQEASVDVMVVSKPEKWDARRSVGVEIKPEPAHSEVAEAGQDLNSAHRVSLPDTKLDKVEVVRSKGCEPVVLLQSSARESPAKRQRSDSEEPPKRRRADSEDLPKSHRGECATPKAEKRYQCKHCQKSFSSYSSLYVHTRLHTGQRPYTCKFCDKRFTHASGMKRHVRCHTGERPYPCTYCPSAFADRGALRSHIRTHTGERPYKCDLCEKTFTQSSSLRVHKKTVHMQNRGTV